LHKFAVENRKGVAECSPEVIESLLAYDWPGNIRELENAIERAIILSKDTSITTADLPQENVSLIGSASIGKNLKEVEKTHILNVLRETGENYSEAARILGVSRMTLYNKAKEYGFDVKK